MGWRVDSGKSKIEFVVKHLQLTKVRGRFTSFDGTLQMNEMDPQSSSVQGSVDAASVRTGIGPRDNSLKARGFFDVKRCPEMTFRSTRIGPMNGNNFKVYGDLTIKDVTRAVVFDVVNKGEQPATQGKRRWAFEATTDLRRKDFGLHWNPLMEFAGLLVGNDVKGIFNIQFVED